MVKEKVPDPIRGSGSIKEEWQSVRPSRQTNAHARHNDSLLNEDYDQGYHDGIKSMIAVVIIVTIIAVIVAINMGQVVNNAEQRGIEQGIAAAQGEDYTAAYDKGYADGLAKAESQVAYAI